MQNMFRDEMKTLQQKVERIENALWETVSEFSLPGVEQSVILSIFPAAGGGGLEGAISVGHLADVYAEYINWNGWTITRYREVPYATAKTKLIGQPFDLVEFEIVGPDVIDLLTLEKGIHRFKRKSENTGNSMPMTYSAAVHARPVISKIARTNVEADLIVISSRGLGGGNADGSVNIRLNVKDPVYGFTFTYDGCGNLQENTKKAVALMTNKIRTFEAEKFESTKAELDANVTQENIRLYDYIHNRVDNHHSSTDDSFRLDDFFKDMTTLSDIHLSVLSFQHETVLKSIFADFSSVEYYFKSFSK